MSKIWVPRSTKIAAASVAAIALEAAVVVALVAAGTKVYPREVVVVEVVTGRADPRGRLPVAAEAAPDA